jgi:hypothetical protein
VAIVFGLGLTPRSAWAASNPVIAGSVSGTELCPQSGCGAATFAGAFSGQPGDGYWSAEVKHNGLPAAGSCTQITGGTWQLTAGSRFFSGDVQKGTLCNTSSPGRYDYFTVRAPLQVKNGGSGRIYIAGTLDHTPLYRTPPQPPTFTGQVTQNAP